MKEFTVTNTDAGRRLDKYIMRILNGAPASFAYKMLRKKNIVLNDRKATGNEVLSEGDVVRFYLADETFYKFHRTRQSDGQDLDHPTDNRARQLSSDMPPVVYEDADILIVNKPSGMLTQKSSADDISLNEICLSYVIKSGSYTQNETAFRPSVCNRLDRNTSGLVTFAKTYNAARILSVAFSNRTIGKYYKCVAVGIIEDDMVLTGTLIKDPVSNKVTIKDYDHTGSRIDTRVHPLRTNGKLTLADIHLVTGKTHQIRAHLAHAMHPILGDNKYGKRELNNEYKRLYGISSQLLTCDRIVFPDDFEIASVSGRTFSISLPGDFDKVM